MPQREGPRLEGRTGAIWAAYLSGRTQEAIAEHHGISQQAVSKIIRTVRDSITDEDRTNITKTEVERLDAILTGTYALACTGDDRAVKNVLAIMERRAKLLGLDQPAKTSVTGDVRFEIVGIDPSHLT